ncbi:hypothetical protein BKA67DRAFT_514549 [Truncatella angustata]|uniref:Uncharacterized protein n=1 Tax=Truncatella angustata TaxID=152316 RepID=A0A9P8UT63_9PEZI|nr:uncharacterized protein BKA67DRAFT_514549 [Truncatella angustata]KAH6658660.1 hypothetical protein BKA67DRAFT_514549 [Truncatella angustata]
MLSSGAAHNGCSCSSCSSTCSQRGCNTDRCPHPPADQTYTVDQLGLFQHISSQANKFLMMEEAKARNMVQLLISNALALPYLMDELLAMAALHLSSLSSDLVEKLGYQRQASLLHNRAISLYDMGSTADAGGDSMGKFLFYSLRSLQNLLEISECEHDSSRCLHRLVDFLHFHQKMRAHKDRALQVLRTTSLQPLIQSIADVDPDAAISRGGRACDELSARIETAGLDPAAMESCRVAIKHLRWVFGVQETFPAEFGGKAHVVMAWPLLIPEHFVDLLDQRRPEALAIVAHYAALLYSCNDLWVFGDRGKCLVQSISGYLQPYWREWLSWPNIIVNAVGWTDSCDDRLV